MEWKDHQGSAAKCRQNKRKKKAEEEAARRVEFETVRKAFQTFAASSDTKEESPKKLSARQAKLSGAY